MSEQNIKLPSELNLLEDFPPVSTEKWEEIIQKDLKGADYDKKLIWKTEEGIKVRPYYRSQDLSKISHSTSLQGQFPYVRGYKTLNNEWNVRQDIKIADVKLINKKILEAVKKGATSISINVSDVKNADDLKVLFKDVCINAIEINISTRGSYLNFLKLFNEYCSSNNIQISSIYGSLKFDPLSTLILTGCFENSFKSEIEKALSLIEISGNIQAITVNAKNFHNAGGNSVQEIAFALAMGNEYLSALSENISIDDAAKNIRFSLGIGSNYFMEIAKVRAFRMLWANVVANYSPKNNESCKTKVHCETSLWNKTMFDPYVNMLRVTTESMSAIIGGCDSLTVNSFDLAYKNSDSFSERIARNTQLILKGESYLDKVADPSAGSYYIESLTDEIAKLSWELFQKIETEGGFIKATEKGIIAEMIEQTAKEKEKNIKSRKQTIVGTNQFPNIDESMLEKITIASHKEKGCCCCCGDTETSIKTIKLYRGSEPFEKLRLETETYISKGNKKPKVFLLTIGNAAMRTARATFTTNFFGVAGYEIINNIGFNSAEEGVEAAIKANSNIVVVCSSDEDYAVYAGEIAQLIKQKNSKTSVVVAGSPVEIIDELKQKGVDDFISMKTNIYESLSNYHKILNIK